MRCESAAVHPGAATLPPVASSPEVPNSDLDLALGLADVADSITLARFRAQDLQVDAKPDNTPVTDADTATEAAIREQLAAARPEDPVFGEEFGGALPGSGRVWVIDPIDATKNFLRGITVYATLIGLIDDGVPTVGVVSAPAMGRRWWAAAGRGAWTQDASGADPRRCRVSGVSDLADASFSYSDHVGWEEQGMLAGFDELRDRVWRSRAYGDFYSHVLVAEGAVDIAAEPELSPWDMAAFLPIVAEAGGTVTSVTGSSPLGGASAVSTNGLLHESTLAVLAGRDTAA